MTEPRTPKKNMVYTPKFHIPVGEALKLPDGSHVLRIKNPATKKYDEISLDSLNTAVIEKAFYAETRTVAQRLAER